MGITLVAADWSGKIPGFDAEQAGNCAFMHDPAVRRWIADQQAKVPPWESARILIADHEWGNRDGDVQYLSLPVDSRDMATVEAIRRELKPPPSRTAGGPGGPRGASMNAGPGRPPLLRHLPRMGVTSFELAEGWHGE